MLAVRANERSAAAAGISVVRVKIVGFAIGSFVAGIGGTLLAYKQTNVTFQSFSVFAGLTVFSTAFLAGITSVSGGVVAGLISAGGILFLSLDRAVDIGPWYAIASGLGVIITVIKNPEGIVGPIHEQLDRRRQAKLRQAAEAASAADPTAPGAEDTAAAGAARVPPTVATRADGEQPGLRVAALTVTYGGVTAVDDVSFSVPAGSITGLIGPNGAGKTTAMDAICGFTSCRGVVELGGRALRDLAPHRRARLGLGRTFQGLDLYEDLTVEENVVVGQYVAGSRASDEHLAAVLATLDLAAERERSVRELSQGHRQLVSIARALAGQPNVLLLDEPAAGLDSAESEWLAARLRAVRDSGVTVLLVDHDVNLVLGLCDEIHVLDFGSLIASGPPSAIRNDPAVTAAYLGSTLTSDAAPGRAIDEGVPS
jgi:sulfate-transporting ATPase